MTKRAAPKPEMATRGFFRTEEPTCWRCGKDGMPGFVGYPSETHTPYTDCKGDPAKHKRTPVAVGTAR